MGSNLGYKNLGMQSESREPIFMEMQENLRETAPGWGWCGSGNRCNCDIWHVCAGQRASRRTVSTHRRMRGEPFRQSGWTAFCVTVLGVTLPV
jgi:hypothetical protein